MTLFYRVCADAVVTIHLAYVLVVVFGLPAIWIGALRRHQWVRNPIFRIGHLAMILVVVAEAWAGMTCPLTVWEQQLRELAGQQTYQGAFLANFFHDLLFVDAKPWVLTWLYTAFGVGVTATFLLVRPRWRRASPRVDSVNSC